MPCHNTLIHMNTQRKITMVLAVFTMFCIAMEMTRMYYSFSLSYIFLIWNLILAWMPYLLSIEFMKHDIQAKKILSFSIIGLWVLFLPNGPYIITDLIHLRNREPIPMWYDVLLVSTFAWHGLLLTLLSVRNMHHKLSHHFSPLKLSAGLLLLFLSSGYGLYLGRFLRWNSWDVFLRPFHLLHDSLIDLIHPFHHPRPILVTVIVCIILSFSYSIFYLINPKPHTDHEII